MPSRTAALAAAVLATCCVHSAAAPESVAADAAADATAAPRPPEDPCAAASGAAISYRLATGSDVRMCALDEALIGVATVERLVAGKRDACVAAFLKGEAAPGKPLRGNPASTNCVDAGGTLVRYVGPEGEGHFCRFEGGCLIEQWTLLRGPAHAGNAALARLAGKAGAP